MSEPFDPYLQWLAIRDPERPPNHYRLLGVAMYESDLGVLANAADRQMLYVRTFQSGRYSAHSQQLLNELSLAKICLFNGEKKAAYDAQLKAQQDAREAQQTSEHPPAAWCSAHTTWFVAAAIVAVLWLAGLIYILPNLHR
jgi:hypothetical protein